MPALKPEYEVLANAVTGRLRGDPSLPLDEEPEEEPAAAEDEEEVLLTQQPSCRTPVGVLGAAFGPTWFAPMRVLLD